jgi:predicted transcriptional regulator
MPKPAQQAFLLPVVDGMNFSIVAMADEIHILGHKIRYQLFM